MAKEKNNIKKESDAQPKTEKQETVKKEACESRKDKNLQKELDALKESAAAKEQELEAAKSALEKEKNDYLRLMAEFETFRRRTAEEKLNIVKSASTDVIKGMLTTLDECERAMSILETSSDEAAKEGTSLIYNKLMAYLKSKGLEVIDAKGKDFDTDYHEAVAMVPGMGDDKKGKVIDCVQTGYMLNDKVIRHAKVAVGQ